MFAENMSCEAGSEAGSCLTQSLGSFTCSCFQRHRKGRVGAGAAEDTYPGIAGSEPGGLHGPAGNGASGHHLRQDGPIAAFLIVMWVPGERGRTRASALGPTPLRYSVPTTT